MKIHAGVVSSSVGVFLLLSSPLAGLTHTLDAPDTLMANEDGSFSYKWVFRAGPDSASYMGYGWSGEDNVGMGSHVDCFCVPGQCTVAEGDSVVFPVVADLVDRTQPGRVRNWFASCDGHDLQTNTTILPHTPTSTGAGSWGRIKALFR